MTGVTIGSAYVEVERIAI